MENKEVIEELREEIKQLREANENLRGQVFLLLGKYPRRVWTCKKRGTTSVEMIDGSVNTVKLRKGEKDCIHTAICYAIVKHMIGSDGLNRLAKRAIEGEELFQKIYSVKK